jgi:hypothetical protein
LGKLQPGVRINTNSFALNLGVQLWWEAKIFDAPCKSKIVNNKKPAESGNSHRAGIKRHWDTFSYNTQNIINSAAICKYFSRRYPFFLPGFDSRRIKNNRQTPMNPIATAPCVDAVVLLQS